MPHIPHNRPRRFSCPTGELPMYSHLHPLDTVNENTILYSPKRKKKGRKGRASFSGPSGDPDLSDYALPGLDEEEVDGNDFRPRSGSAGIKSLIKFRHRNKSGDIKNNLAHGTPPEDRKGIKGFLDNFRPRSKSDATSLRQAAMMRKKHASGGSQGPDIQHRLTDTQQSNMLGGGDMEPMPRARSTSLGAKDRLRMIKKDIRVTGQAAVATDNTTMMGKLISSNGISHPNGASLQYSSSGSEKANSSTGSFDQQSHRYTGQALIWTDEDKQSDGAVGADLDKLQIEDIEENDPHVFNKFMRAHKCYDIIPNSSKLIVFDTSLSVKKAFYALVYNCVRSAPLWDNKAQQFVGMLTITDFILILHKYYKSPEEKMQELEEHMISSWRKELSSHYKSFVSISPEDSVCAAVRKLSKHKVHRLPVVDPVSGNAVYIMTHKRILKFVHIFMKNIPKPSYVNDSIKSLNIGTYGNMHSVSLESKVIDAFDIFVKSRVSALPVVNSENKVVNIYARFDVIHLAANKSYNNLDVTIEEALKFRPTKTEHVITCYPTDSLGKVIEKIVKAGVHRLVVTNTENELMGVVSLSDILTFLLQEDSVVSSKMEVTTCSSALTAPEKMAMSQATIEATG